MLMAKLHAPTEVNLEFYEWNIYGIFKKRKG